MRKRITASFSSGAGVIAAKPPSKRASLAAAGSGSARNVSGASRDLALLPRKVRTPAPNGPGCRSRSERPWTLCEAQGPPEADAAAPASGGGVPRSVISRGARPPSPASSVSKTASTSYNAYAPRVFSRHLTSLSKCGGMAALVLGER
jgi:hypothetical protein